ncbi:Protein DHS-20 [Aphelenchoides avenae]|nr:Protein DHS-20 [Aphelenchus avenae]
MTSSYGRAVAPIYGPYTVSKFAADAYTSTIRQELRQFGVKVITLAPGYILTPITRVAMINGVEQTWKATSQAVREEYGNDFCSKWQKGLLNLLDAVPRGQNIDLVVNQYFAAMTSVFPRERYSVGVDAKFFFVPISLLPSYVSDNVIRLCIWYFSSKETSLVNGS